MPDLPNTDPDDMLDAETNPLYRTIIPFTESKDKEGSVVMSTRVPGRMYEFYERFVAVNKMGVRTQSDFVRMCIFHVFQHIAELTDDDDMRLEWGSMEMYYRAADMEKRRGNDQVAIDGVAETIKRELEGGDLDVVVYTIERLGTMLLAMPDDHPRRRSNIRMMANNPSWWAALQMLRKQSTIIQELYEEAYSLAGPKT